MDAALASAAAVTTTLAVATTSVAAAAAFAAFVPAAAWIHAFGARHALVLLVEHGLVVLDCLLVVQFVANVKLTGRSHQQYLRWQCLAPHRFTAGHIEQRNPR